MKETNRKNASVEIEGRPMRIGLDYGREQTTMQKLLAQLAVPVDPRVALATYPPRVQAAVAAGMVMIGMTKEQAVMALGPPRADRTPSIDAAEWTYWTNESEEYVLLWDAQQRLKEVDAARKVKKAVLME